MTDSLANELRDPVDSLAERFLQDHQAGRAPDPEEFLARHPEHADELRAVLSAILLIEEAKDDELADAPVEPAHLGSGTTSCPSQLGDYRILREIGRGGMGVVYEAEQGALGRRVAVKVLTVRPQRSGDQVRRFYREARAAARLHHTNIVPLFEIGEQDGHHYYVMQYIQGAALDQVLARVLAIRQNRLADPTEVDSRKHTPPTRYRPSIAPETDARPLEDDPKTRETAILDPWAQTRPHPDAEPSEPLADPEEAEHSTDSERNGELATSTLAVVSGAPRSYARRVAAIGRQVAEALAYAVHHGVLHRDIKPGNILLDHDGVAWLTDFGLAKAHDDDDLTRSGDLVGTLRYMAPERFGGRSDARSDVYGLGLTLYELLVTRPAFPETDQNQLIYRLTHGEPPIAPHRIDRSIPVDLSRIVMKAIERDPADRYADASALASDLTRFLEDRPIAVRPISPPERLLRWGRRSPLTASLTSLLLLTLVTIAVGGPVAAWKIDRQRRRAEEQRAEAVSARREGDRRLIRTVLSEAVATRSQADSSATSRLVGRRDTTLAGIAEVAPLDVAKPRRAELRNAAIGLLALSDLVERPLWMRPDPEAPFDVNVEVGLLAIAQPDGAVRLRSLEDREAIWTVPRPTTEGPSTIDALWLGPRGRWLVVRRIDESPDAPEGPSTLYDLSGFAQNLRFEPEPRPLGPIVPGALAFRADGRRLALGRPDGHLTVLDPERPDDRRELVGGPIPTALAFDPSGRRLAVASADPNVAVQVRTLEDEAGEILLGVVESATFPAGASALTWHPRDDRLAVGCLDRLIYWLEVDPIRRPIPACYGHRGAVTAVAFDPTGRSLVSGSTDGTVRIWSTADGLEQTWLKANAFALQFDRAGRRLGLTASGRLLRLWELDPSAVLSRLGGPGQVETAIHDALVIDDGHWLITAGDDGLQWISLDDGQVHATVPVDRARGLAYDPDGPALLVAAAYGLERWPIRRMPDVDGPDGRPARLILGPPRNLPSLSGWPLDRIVLQARSRSLSALTTTSTLILGALGDRDVEVNGTWTDLGASVDQIALSPNGRWIVDGSQEHGARLRDARQPRSVWPLTETGQPVRVAFGPTGTRLLIGSPRVEMLQERVGSGFQPRWYQSRAVPAQSRGVSAFHPSGRLAVRAVEREDIELIDLEGGEVLAQFHAPDAPSTVALAFDASGSRLVVVSDNHRGQLWDLRALAERLETMGLGWDQRLFEPVSRFDPRVGQSRRDPIVIEVREPAWRLAMRRGVAAEDPERSRAAFDEAARAFDVALGAEPRHHLVRARRAVLRLAAGDHDGYRDDCQALAASTDLEADGRQTLDDERRNLVAWGAALGPDGGLDPDVLTGLAQSVLRAMPANHERMNTYGATLVRAGRLEEAQAVLEEAIVLHGEGGTPYDWVFLALAERLAGRHDDDVQALLIDVRDWLDRALVGRLDNPRIPYPLSWHHAVQIRTLLNEAADPIEVRDVTRSEGD